MGTAILDTGQASARSTASTSQSRTLRLTRLLIWMYAALGGGLACYFLLIPGVLVIRELAAVPPESDEIPAVALRLHQNLTPRYERWARSRLRSGRAATLSTKDISGTEWPLFGSVFYLWSTAALQDAWEQDRSRMPAAPAVYARGAIEAATALVLDSNHAAWVRRHWGDQYLERENVFFRMLLISALTSHARLTGSSEHLPLLRTQVDGLSAELARSPHGLLDDYPGECYPADVLAAIAAIHHADRVLGTDHAAFVAAAQRGFRGQLLDERGLVPYFADAVHGRQIGGARGCSNSFASLCAPSVWPELAADWYGRYEEHFWQHRWGAVGFREFPRGTGSRDWHHDVDAGPVLAGHGFAASAFGLGAARVNGRFDHAYPLTLETLALSWPLPDGSLGLPRLLSNTTDAPYLGEVGILFNLTRTPAPGIQSRYGHAVPRLVYVVSGLYFVLGVLVILSALRQARRRCRQLDHATVPRARLQIGAWVTLLLGAVVATWVGQLTVALLAVLVLGRVPFLGRRAAPRPRATLSGAAKNSSRGHV